MTRIIPYLFAIVISFHPARGLCSYLIHLKNGAQIVTNQYWEEEDQIKFYVYGGVVGIEKFFVEKISESARPFPMETRQSKEKAPVPKPETPQPETQNKKETPLPTDPEKEAFLEKKAHFTSEIKSAMEAFKTAKHQKDSQKIQNERKKILSLKTELSNLEKEVKKHHAGRVPDWWDMAEAPASTD